MDVKLLVAVIGLLVGISGWVTFFYNFINHRPKINGRIFSPIIGQFTYNVGEQTKQMTSYLVYLYLTTNRVTPIRVLDYKMEIAFTDGTVHKLERIYGTLTEKLTFTGIDNRDINLNLSENLIYKKNAPIEQKEPLHGFVLFGGSEDLYTKTKEKITITAIDVFGNYHVISESNMEKPLNIHLLGDLAGFDVPDSINKPSEQTTR